MTRDELKTHMALQRLPGLLERVAVALEQLAGPAPAHEEPVR